MKTRPTILNLIVLLLISCGKGIDNNIKNTYQPYKVDLISRKLSKENKIYKCTTISNLLESNKKDTLQIIEFDEKGNLLELRRFGFYRPKLKKYYNDTLLIKKEEYNSENLKNFTTYYYTKNIRIDSSYFAYPKENQLYNTTKYYRDNQNRDTLRVSEDYILKSVYDEKGLKEEYEIKDNKKYISKRVIKKADENIIYNYNYGVYYKFKDDTTSISNIETKKFNKRGMLIEYKSEGNDLEEHNMKYTKKYNDNNLPLKDTYYENGKPVYEILYTYEYFDN